ncbi:type II toxin-antitoxin system Phd/YefM family antitoxin [Nonomuraea candida]|uniref:type II toxin-antitoxin system Phd/YefM family antitoxin n=1 Tax=Nonomuraea candida TaxID=359159 RepID=UPI0005BC5717|nr:type II toxin-antitoxin system Phd/YefM family antitoxin [Nonomuraea candida]
MTTTHDSLGISEARSQLGTLVARAVHGRRHTTISRSTTERAVLISEEEFEEYVRLKREREAAEVRAKMDAVARGEREMTIYTSREQGYADLGLGDVTR